MKQYDYLIIGCGIAGVTAAETIREREARAAVAIMSDEPHVLYSRVLLPAYLKGHVPREKLFLRTLDHFTAKRIDLYLHEEVVAIDVARREVTLGNGISFGYGKLLITTGGRVRRWGTDQDQKFIYRFQTLDDADRLSMALATIKQPVVIGSSFISLELLEIFVIRNIPPVALVRGDQFLGAMLDKEGALLLTKNFERHGITCYFDDEVATITQEKDAVTVHTKQSRIIASDALAVGVGIERNTALVHGSGFNRGEQGILVNEFLETNQEGVYAAGDVAEFYDLIMGAHRMVGNWTHAVLQGKRAGLNMTGEREPFRHVTGYSIKNLGFHITALGDCTDERDTVVRIDPHAHRYERFFLRNGVLVGAVLINCFPDKPRLASLIEKKTALDEYRTKLSNFTFDITTIPVVIL